MFAVFIEKGFQLVKENHIVTLVHMDNMVMGIAFGTSATIFRKQPLLEYKGQYCYITLDDIVDGVPLKFPIVNDRYKNSSSKIFLEIPDSPISYWISERGNEIFLKSKLLGEVASPAKHKLPIYVRTSEVIVTHVANQKISIELDDGVSVNYAKFQGVEVPQGEGKKVLKADLLAKI